MGEALGADKRSIRLSLVRARAGMTREGEEANEEEVEKNERVRGDDGGGGVREGTVTGLGFWGWRVWKGVERRRGRGAWRKEREE